MVLQVLCLFFSWLLVCIEFVCNKHFETVVQTTVTFYDFLASRTLSSSRTQRDGKHLRFSHKWISLIIKMLIVIYIVHGACQSEKQLSVSC